MVNRGWTLKREIKVCLTFLIVFCLFLKIHEKEKKIPSKDSRKYPPGNIYPKIFPRDKPTKKDPGEYTPKEKSPPASRPPPSPIDN